MLNTGKWRSVSRSAPCPVCGKPDWCFISTDGAAAGCYRIESRKHLKGGAWLHHVNGNGVAIARPDPQPSARPEPTRQDLELLARSFRSAVPPTRLGYFSRELGLTVASLDRLDIGWSVDQRCWAFPMRDAELAVRGIRMRTLGGKKFAITGGREGLFIPSELRNERLFVCEGPTDTAALLDLGFDAVGRPSCMGGTQLLLELLGKREIAAVVIVADGDAPGQRGAEDLARAARLYCADIRIMTPPAGIKDARAWKRAGATAADVERAARCARKKDLKVAATGVPAEALMV